MIARTRVHGAPGIECPVQIPSHLWPGLRAYVMDGRPVGTFLRAVIGNNLKDSVAHADATSLAALVDIVRWFYNEAPSACWGGPQRYADWVELGGLAGLNEEIRLEDEAVREAAALDEEQEAQDGK